MRTFNSTVSSKKTFGNFYQKWQEKKQTYKSRMRTVVFSFLIGAVTLTGCSKDDSIVQPDDPNNPVTAISSMSPENGPKETTVTINGTNFGTDTNVISISINGVEASITNLTNTQIEFAVPPRAYNGDVMVSINGTEYTAGYFDYEISEVQVSTFAGTISGDTNGDITTAKFNSPFSMAFDSEGYLFVVDHYNHKIKKVSPNGNVSTFAGSTQGFNDGTGASAKFNGPEGIVIDDNDNLYITDGQNHRIRRITREGYVTTIAGSTMGDTDGLEDAAQFHGPSGITIDANNNLYVTDSENHKIKKITPDGMVTTIAGADVKGYVDGTGSDAMFTIPRQITLGTDNVLYVAEYGGDGGLQGVRKVTLDGVVTTVTGSNQSDYVNGAVEEARFRFPQGMVTDDLGNIYVADEANGVIRRISKNGMVTTLAGSTTGSQDGEGSNAQFDSIRYLTIDADYNIYVADYGNHRIRKITQE